VCLLYGGHALAVDTILLRDGRDPVQGTILSGGDTGLQIQRNDPSLGIQLIPWSTIKAIHAGRPTPALDIFLQRGHVLWRAKSRLLRGDVHLAEQLFATSFANLVGTDGFDARLASEGLLRCTLSRGELAKAVHPWFETARLSELDVAEPFPTLERVLDPTTMLCPHLPPIWMENRALIQATSSYANVAQRTTASIARLLSLPMMDDDPSPVEGVDDPYFLSLIILASNGESKARETLSQRVDAMVPWKQAWSHYFLAIGYLAEQSSDARTKGMLYLAKVAAKSRSIQPWLAGASMIRLSDELARDGFIEKSRRIMDEAKRYFPTHPLLEHDEYQIRNLVR